LAGTKIAAEGRQGAAGKNPCAKLATECSAAEAIAADAHRAPPFAGGRRSDVRRNRSPMRSRQKPRFLPAAGGVMSAEIASCDFGQID